MTEHAPPGPVDVTPAGVSARHARGVIQLVDVREDDEYAAGRIAGARHLEVGRVAAEADTIERDRPVVFYCRVGARSAMAAAAVRRAGWEPYSMPGGREAWSRGDLPLEPEDGHVADH